MKKIFRRKSSVDRVSGPDTPVINTDYSNSTSNSSNSGTSSSNNSDVNNDGAPVFNASYLRRLSLPNNSLDVPVNSSGTIPERRRFSIAGGRLSRDSVPVTRRRSTAQANAIFQREPNGSVDPLQVPLQGSSSNYTTATAMEVEHENSDNEEDSRSLALSDTKTLYHTRQSQMELQETYNDNFTLYVPYLFRQWRLATLAYQNAHNASGGPQLGAPVSLPDDTDMETAPLVRQEMMSRAARAAREYLMSDADVDDDSATVIGSIRSRDEIMLDNASPPNASSEGTTPPSTPSSLNIMSRSTSRYNHKRQFIITNEFLKHNAFVFVDADSFKTFKNLRLNAKQEKKTTSVFYNPLTKSYVRYLNTELPPPDSGLIPDMRQHIIGPDHKALGIGLPLLKVQVPYLSSFRKNAPFIVIRKFREVPLPPSSTPLGRRQSIDENVFANDEDDMVMDLDPKTASRMHLRSYSDVNGKKPTLMSNSSLKSSTSSTSSYSTSASSTSSGSLNSSSPEDGFESYEYCTVHVKYFQHCRRYVLQFTPEGSPLFSVVVFQHNFKPFADFIYKNTRFRVFGTPIVTGYLVNYNPTLKLMIVDPDKPLLTDEVFNKKQEFDLKSLIKRRRSSAGNENDPKNPALGIAVNPCDERIAGMDNPYPGYSNGLIHLDYMSSGRNSSSSFISNKLPTFGLFKDVIAYEVDDDNFRLLPKKFSEVGKFETYQEITSNASTSARPYEESLSSTKTINTDTLVLSCVMLMLREVSIRNSSRQNSLMSSWSLQSLNTPTYRYGNGGGGFVI